MSCNNKKLKLSNVAAVSRGKQYKDDGVYGFTAELPVSYRTENLGNSCYRTENNGICHFSNADFRWLYTPTHPTCSTAVRVPPSSLCIKSGLMIVDFVLLCVKFSSILRVLFTCSETVRLATLGILKLFYTLDQGRTQFYFKRGAHWCYAILKANR